MGLQQEIHLIWHGWKQVFIMKADNFGKANDTMSTIPTQVRIAGDSKKQVADFSKYKAEVLCPFEIKGGALLLYTKRAAIVGRPFKK